MHNRFLLRGFHSVTLISLLIPAVLLWSASPPAYAQDTATSQITDEDTLLAVKQAHDADHPVVALQTNLGTLHLELFPAQAPKSVENFLTYVKDGFYDGTVFHRVIEGFMIQGGGLDLRLEAKETREPVANEADNGLQNEPFTLAMARTGDPHSATAQFFINTANNDFLNHKSKTPAGWGYTVIGKLVGGMRIAEWMSKAPTGPGGQFPSDVPITPIVIEKAQLLQ